MAHRAVKQKLTLRTKAVMASLLVGLVSGVVLLSYSAFQYRDDQQLASHPVAIQATITTKSRQLNLSKYRATSYDYEVSYTFSLAGHTYSNSEQVEQNTWQTVHTGSPVIVIYSSKKPAVNYLQGYQRDPSDDIVALAASGLLAIACLLLLGFIWRALE